MSLITLKTLSENANQIIQNLEFSHEIEILSSSDENISENTSNSNNERGKLSDLVEGKLSKEVARDMLVKIAKDL
jgi:hypothetical protein